MHGGYATITSGSGLAWRCVTLACLSVLLPFCLAVRKSADEK